MIRNRIAWKLATSVCFAFTSAAYAAPVSPGTEPICEAIRAFANATPDARAHSITIYSQLRYEESLGDGTVWVPATSRECLDDSTQEGANLCKAVLSNVSYEFPASAGTRAAACLSGRPYDSPQGVAVLQFGLAVRTFDMKGVRPGTQVDAEYQTLRLATSEVGVFRLFASRRERE